MKEIDKTTDTNIRKRIADRIADRIVPPYYVDDLTVKKGVLKAKNIFDVLSRTRLDYKLGYTEHVEIGKKQILVKNFNDTVAAIVSITGYGGEYKKTILVFDPSIYEPLQKFGEEEGFGELTKSWDY